MYMFDNFCSLTFLTLSIFNISNIKDIKNSFNNINKNCELIFSDIILKKLFNYITNN